MIITAREQLYIETKDSRIISYLVDSLTKKNPVWEKNRRNGYSNYKTPKYYNMYTKTKSGIIIPRGTGKLARSVAETYGEGVKLVDKRTWGKPIDVEWNDEYIPYWYQREAVEEMKKDQQGLVKAPCGSGKTIIICRLIHELKRSVMIIVHTSELFDQWQDQIGEFLHGDYSLGIIGGTKKKHGDITIAMIQTLANFKPSQWKEIQDQYSICTLDECFPERTDVTLSDGSKLPINKIVNNRLPVMVKSFNLDTLTYENKRVVRWIKIPRRSNFVQIRLNRNTQRDSLRCTPIHKFITQNRGEVQAGELTTNDVLYLEPDKRKRNGFAPDFGPVQLQIIYGSILGDGHLSINSDKSHTTRLGRMQLQHGKEQYPYLEYKANIINATVDPKLRYSGYTKKFTIMRAQTRSHKQLFDLLQLSPEQIFDLLGPLGFAIMFGDNGSCQHRTGASLHTERYSYETNLYFVEAMKRKWDIDAIVGEYSRGPKKYYYIRFRKDATRKLANLIRRYLHPNVRYKLGVRKFGSFEEVASDSRVFCTRYIEKILTEEPTHKRYNFVYNLEVEGNHNYCANSMLVSNCHHAAADTYVKCMKNISAKYLLGVSATPKRTDKKDFLVSTYLGDEIHEITDDDLKIAGRRVSCRVSIVNTNVRYNWDKLNQDHTLLTTLMAEDVARNKLIIEKILLDIENDRLPLVIINRVSHSMILKSSLKMHGIKVGEIIGSVPTWERAKVRKGVKEGKYQCLVVSRQIAAEGLDIESISSVHIPFWTSNLDQIKQMIGRGQRVFESKEFCQVWMYHDELFETRIDEETLVTKIVEPASFYISWNKIRKFFRDLGFPIETVENFEGSTGEN